MKKSLAAELTPEQIKEKLNKERAALENLQRKSPSMESSWQPLLDEKLPQLFQAGMTLVSLLDEMKNRRLAAAEQRRATQAGRHFWEVVFLQSLRNTLGPQLPDLAAAAAFADKALKVWAQRWRDSDKPDKPTN